MAASFTGGSGPNGAGDRRLLAADDGGLLHGWQRRLPGAGDGGLRLLGVVDRRLPGAGDDGLLHWRWRAGGLEGGSTGEQAGGRRRGWGGGVAAVTLCGAGTRAVLLCQVWVPWCVGLFDRALI
jgi:hypothetical protein